MKKKPFKLKIIIIILILCAIHGIFIIKNSFNTFPEKWKTNKALPIIGEVVSLPIVKENSTKFQFETKDGLLLLTWRNSYKNIVPGDRYKLLVKIDKPYSLSNPML